MAKTDKERLATGFWNRIESNQAADCNKDSLLHGFFHGLQGVLILLAIRRLSNTLKSRIIKLNRSLANSKLGTMTKLSKMLGSLQLRTRNPRRGSTVQLGHCISWDGFKNAPMF